MPNITVTIDGTEHEVDLKAAKLPDGYQLLSAADLKSGYKTQAEIDANYVHTNAIDARFKNWVKKSEAHTDESVVAKVLEAHKGAKDVDLEQAKANWSKDQLEPVLNENKALKSRALGDAIRVAATKAKFDSRFVERPDASIPSWVESAFASRFEFDPELGEFVALENGHRVPASEPKNGRMFADAEEYLQRLAKQDTYKPFLKPEERIEGGSGYKGGGNGQVQYKKRGDMSPAEKAEAMEALGRDDYLKLPE